MAKQQQNHSSTGWIEWNIVEFRWEQTDKKESGCGLMWTPVCLVLQNPGWLEHIPITSTMLLKGNLFPSMCWMKLYRIIFTTVCVLGAYQQTPTTGVPCTVQIAWFGQNGLPGHGNAKSSKMTWSVVGSYDFLQNHCLFCTCNTCSCFCLAWFVDLTVATVIWFFCEDSTSEFKLLVPHIRTMAMVSSLCL